MKYRVLIECFTIYFRSRLGKQFISSLLLRKYNIKEDRFMPEYCYVATPTMFRELLKRIKNTEIGIPLTANRGWLETIGYRSKNHRNFIKVLKFINMIDSSNKPLPLWNDFRGINGRVALGKAIKDAYGELFLIYPRAFESDDKELKSFFSSKTTGQRQVIDNMAMTFKILCEFADFNDSSSTEPSKIPKELETQEVASETPPLLTASTQQSQNVVVNLNIQLTLPETKDPKIYDEFFSALKKHLYPKGS